MLKCYAVRRKNGSFVAPLEMVPIFNGIKGWDKLTDAEREEFGWYNCEILNQFYDSRIKERSTYAECVHNTTTNVVIGVYNLRPIHIDILRARKCSEVGELYKEKLYSNVAATFPSGVAMIQFRDEIDRTNISNVASGAMALCMGGNPDAIMEFRTEDDVVQVVTAYEMMHIALQVLTEKQSILKVSWEHKDTVNSLIDPIEIVEYDFTTGW